MALYYFSNHYLQNHQADDDGEDGFTYNSSHDFASDQPFSTSYYDNSDNKFPESQFFGYDLHRPDDIEDAPTYSSSYTNFPSNQQPITSYSSRCFDDDSRHFGGYGYNHPAPYYASYCAYSPVQPTVGYSVSPLYESKSFEIDPNHINPAGPYVTQSVISYSSVEFNEPDFEEYDPTPYGGGYDPSSTYGKPLPPSDETCYPRDSSNAEVQIPGGIVIPEEVNTSGLGNGIDIEEEQPVDKLEDPKPIVPAVEVEATGDHVEGAYDYLPQEGPLGGNEKMFPPAPPGFGLDAVDLCESLFGYWPCLARDARRGYGCPQVYGYGGRCIQRNDWEDAANYLFGSPDPDRGGNGGRYDHGIGGFHSSSSVYAQEKHY